MTDDHLKITLVNIPMVEMRLADTWFNEIQVSHITRSTTSPESDGWPCAVNIENRVLFTQLISNTGQMRDGYYEYLLSIGNDLMVISYNGKASLEMRGSWNRYPYQDIVDLVNRCAVMINCDHKALDWNDRDST